MIETRSRLRAIWHILRRRKVAFRATPRVIVKPHDQAMFEAIMSERLRLVDTSPVLQEGSFTLSGGAYNVSNPIILDGGAHIVGQKKEGKDNAAV